MRYRFIGDTILTIPFLRNLRKAFPDATIDMMVAPYSYEVLFGNPYVDEFIIYDPATVHADSFGQHARLSEKIKFIRKLREKHYDKAYVLKRSFSSALISYLIGARERIGFDTEHRGFLLTKRVPYLHSRHEVENFLAVLEADGVRVTDKHLEAWISDEERQYASKFLESHNLKPEQRLIAIHPFSANQKRAWHESNFATVANQLQRKFGARVIVFGGKRDLPLVPYFQQEINPPPIIVVGKTSLRQTMALLERCSLLICNDSGIMHLAAALNLPLVALFGPQSPVKFGPWGEKCHVIYKNFPCSPCKQKFFEECEPSKRLKPMCMEVITIDEVLNAIEKKFSTFIQA